MCPFRQQANAAVTCKDNPPRGTAAVWGAKLAVGAGRGRIYIGEPVASIEDEPNVTNKRFSGILPSRTVLEILFASAAKSRIGRVIPPTGIKEIHDHLANLKQRGLEAIDE
jgi:hypothetical protein